MRRDLVGVLFILALTAVIGMPGAASASSVAIDAPITVGSWAQTFQWYPPPAHIDTIEVFIVSGNTDLETPGMANFSNGWSATRINPDYARASGTAMGSSFTFNVRYTANPEVPFFQDFVGWYQGAISEAWQFEWTGSNWVLNTGKAIPFDTPLNRAPLPPTALLLGSGLLGLVGLGWRRRRKS